MYISWTKHHIPISGHSFSRNVLKFVFSFFQKTDRQLLPLSRIGLHLVPLVFSYFLYQEIASTLTSFIQKLVYSYFLYPEIVSTLTTFIENSSEVSAQNLDKGSKCTSYFPYWEFIKELLEKHVSYFPNCTKKVF